MKLIFLTLCLIFGSIHQNFAQEYSSYATLSLHKSGVQNLRFSHDGRFLATGGHDAKVIIWNVKTGKPVHQLLGHKGRVSEVTFSPNNKYLVSASSDGSCKVWNVNTGTLVGTYFNRMKSSGQGYFSISFAAFTADSKEIFFAGDGGALMKAKISKNPATGKSYPAKRVANLLPMSKSGYYSDRITGGALGPDGKSIIVSIGNKVKVVNMQGALIKTFFYGAKGINDVIAGPGSTQISTWSQDGKVIIWDFNTGIKKKIIQAGKYGEYSAAAFSKDGTKLAAGTIGTVANVYDVNTNKIKCTLIGHTRIVRTTRYSPTADIIATASYDGTAKLWDVSKPQVVEKPVNNDETIETKEEIVKVTDTIYIDEEIVKYDTLHVTDTVYQNVVVEENTKPTSIKEAKIEVGAKINLKNIQFDRGQYTLRPSSHAELDHLVDLLNKYPNMVIRLEGHTDNVGDSQKNYLLSNKRIIVVENYLIDKGIDEKRIKIKAYGGTKPLANNNTEESRKLNRRVEMIILKL